MFGHHGKDISIPKDYFCRVKIDNADEKNMTLVPLIENGWNIWIKVQSNGYKWNMKSLRRKDLGDSWSEFWDNEGI